MTYAADCYEPPEYYERLGIEDEEITEKAIELLEKDGDLLSEAFEECWNVTLNIAGHDPRRICDLECELLQGKHNKNFVYMQHAYLEGLAIHSKYLRGVAEDAINKEIEANEEAFLMERWAA